MATETLSIRSGNNADHELLGQLIHDAVRTGPSPYSETQRAAWVPAPRKGKDWSARLAAQTIFIAEADGQALGFMTLAADGYLDFAYILPAARGLGLFRQLYECVETEARKTGEPRIWVHASLMAAPAFKAMGFKEIERETVHIDDVALDRFLMEKPL
ncbi:GNAT family N-acetyltransferase [Henriciella litoralis]|uniref:GNAT family N-acetyltransferase n=1 Tax=Henriciella litoralis TaxID=568102 RepID=UPI000A019E4A|nr:GNAT family N-acetyltransferase [Henriciella litoralis]